MHSWGTGIWPETSGTKFRGKWPGMGGTKFRGKWPGMGGTKFRGKWPGMGSTKFRGKWLGMGGIERIDKDSGKESLECGSDLIEIPDKNIFNDDASVGSLSDVREFCENLTSLSINKPYAYKDETNVVTDNDALTSQSFTFLDNSVNSCMESESMQNNIKDIKDTENIENVENVENVEDIENVEDVEDIENIVLHTDDNIDAFRLYSEEISGRRIADLGHVFAELQRLSTHWIGECRFIDLVFRVKKRDGLKIQFSVKCRMCHFTGDFWSEPTDEIILDVNKGVVSGTILTGTGHKQLEELLAAVDIPCMSNKTYIKYHNEMSETFAAAEEEEMRMAGEEEKWLAIKRGDIIDGIPHIPVITDGSWMKRSYRTGGYDSPSGVAIITGYYSKKVLFVGVRNKYCIVCARAAKINAVAKEHICFKNWGSNQSSTSMESDIILEGFRLSLEMHGLIYSKYIGDGDSNVLKKLRDFPPYPNIVVQKIECTNHLLRNLCNKIREAGSTGSRNISKLKKAVADSVMKIRNAVVKAVTFRRNREKMPIAYYINLLVIPLKVVMEL
ncbi:hypothetical protein RF55_14620 [Lasius niger]|uniref:Mutator-like transposase domain-containing protein n=1 Tax=Lasius niger TaxID=67767 RepID=A0A0J7K857_LASNI|nr:hypothetical protein RF55_14620 [Lasius niger]